MSSHVTIGGLVCSTCSIADLMEDIQTWRGAGGLDRCKTILCVNAHISNLAAKDSSLAAVLNACDILAMDGMSMVWAGRFFGAEVRERCNMTEAFRTFLESSAFKPSCALLIGMEQHVVERAAMLFNEQSSHCRITRAASGYETMEMYQQIVQEEPWDFIFIGRGSPHSEILASCVEPWGSKAIVWHVGAGTIKFLAGEMSEAPLWMRRSGLQWIHRLFLEPKKLWRRYLLGNIAFVLRLFRSRK